MRGAVALGTSLACTSKAVSKVGACSASITIVERGTRAFVHISARSAVVRVAIVGSQCVIGALHGELTRYRRAFGSGAGETSIACTRVALVTVSARRIGTTVSCSAWHLRICSRGTRSHCQSDNYSARPLSIRLHPCTKCRC